MELHRQVAPRKLSWVNRLWLSFLLRQYRKAHLKKDIAARKLTKYADQLGHWDWAMRCVKSDLNAWWTKDQTGLSQPNNHRTTPTPAAPAAPAAPFQNSAPTPPDSFAISIPVVSSTGNLPDLKE